MPSLLFGASGETRLHFLSGGKKIEGLPPSSRRQATVHRTVVFNLSSLTPFVFGDNYGYNLRRQFDKCTPVTKFVPQGVRMILGVLVK